MTYTKFGEFMRVLRVQHHEVMGDVAKLLGVSTPFLSAVENGRKNVPNEWFDIIAEHYALSDDEIADMKLYTTMILQGLLISKSGLRV